MRHTFTFYLMANRNYMNTSLFPISFYPLFSMINKTHIHISFLSYSFSLCIISAGFFFFTHSLFYHHSLTTFVFKMMENVNVVGHSDRLKY